MSVLLKNNIDVPKFISDLKVVRHLNWHDGPLLSEFQGTENDSYLCKWVDMVYVSPPIYPINWAVAGIKCNRWLLIKTDINNIDLYNGDKILLQEILSESDHVYFLDIDRSGKILYCYKYLVKDIPKDYV